MFLVDFNAFFVFKFHGEAEEVLIYSNSRHPNIKITIETKVNQVIPFMNVLIL